MNVEQSLAKKSHTDKYNGQTTAIWTNVTRKRNLSLSFPACIALLSLQTGVTVSRGITWYLSWTFTHDALTVDTQTNHST